MDDPSSRPDDLGRAIQDAVDGDRKAVCRILPARHTRRGPVLRGRPGPCQSPRSEVTLVNLGSSIVDAHSSRIDGLPDAGRRAGARMRCSTTRRAMQHHSAGNSDIAAGVPQSRGDFTENCYPTRPSSRSGRLAGDSPAGRDEAHLHRARLVRRLLRVGIEHRVGEPVGLLVVHRQEDVSRLHRAGDERGGADAAAA